MFFFLKSSVYIYRYWDKGILEYLGPIGIYRITHWLGFQIELLASGFIPHQAFIFIFSILLFLIFPLYLIPFLLF